MGEIIGYIRVSTAEQNTARQESNLDSMCDRLFIEKISGKDTNRPQLKAMMDYVRKGDTVVVDSYSRFARSTKDLIELVERLKEKGVAFKSLKEKDVDTTTAHGELIFTIFAGLAQFERAQILERQREGIAIAKAEGKYKGRQRIKFDHAAFEQEYKAWKNGEQTAKETMSKLGLQPNTFYRRVKEYEQRAEA